MTLSRRNLLKATAGAGALLMLPGSARAQSRRTSPLAGRNYFLVQSDLHNHTLLSDGFRRPEEAFAQLRAAGLDVAALTDHATAQKSLGPAGQVHCPSTCGAVAGITEADWQHLGGLADAADAPGAFTAMRGFEWTTLSMGHLNVWFSQNWTDGLTMRGFGSKTDVVGAAERVDGATPLPARELAELLVPVLEAAPPEAAPTTQMLYEWLTSAPDRPLLGGGADALAGFNHPNLYGNFDDFRFDERVRQQIVSLEMFSFGKDDYLYEGVDDGKVSGLSTCLDAGWRVGLLGTSDEHGAVYQPRQGRGGLWVKELSRAGVREAMAARRFFAAAEPGIHLYAVANGARMGGTVPFRRGILDIEWDLQIEGAEGRSLLVQVLATGTPLPTVVDTVETVIRPGRRARLRVHHSIDDGNWIVLRVTDPTSPSDARASGPYAEAGRAIAYSSPFFLQAAGSAGPPPGTGRPGPGGRGRHARSDRSPGR